MGYHDEPKDRENAPDVESKEEYAFLQETFKDEKGKGRIKRSTIIKCAGLGLVFGLTASLGFFALKPWAESIAFGNPNQVTIPEEENPEAEEEEEEVQIELPALTIDNYREMNKALYEVGNEASRCVAEIIGITAEDEWQGTEYDKGNSVSGIIIADNGPEFLIFASSSVLRDAESIQVKFVDGKTYGAEVKRRDENLGFAVYSAAKSELSDSTKARIAVAVLGTSGSMSQGDTVIALGSPFGYAGAMGFGVVASPKNTIQTPDGEYRLICTDISGARNGTGALINIKGEVVGIIDQAISDEDSMNLVTGYGISDLKSTIELLSNGAQVPYLGIIGVTVTEQVAQDQGIPEGVYVQEVRADSPAMAAGIQSGDVLVGIGKEKTVTLSAYHSQLLKQEVGSSVKLQGMRKGNDGYVDVSYTVTIGSCE
ncbi:MAG: PDZ domain-containing protein [Eubacteriales bacterium]|nr:PDZ domain-containing protein [Eubacteriales bacterium]